jgi:uncharacterized membrane protein YfcA
LESSWNFGPTQYNYQSVHTPNAAVLITEYSPWVIAWCALAMVCGGLIKGALGVGTPLLTVPMMAMVLPPQMAVVMMAMPVIVANVWQVKDAGHPRDTLIRFWPALLALMTGTWIGVKVLKGIDERALLYIVGIAVICFTLLQGSSRKITIPAHFEKMAGLVFCTASGIIGGLSSMFGPMLILYLVSITNLNKNQFVGTISFFYIVAVVPWVVIMVLVGVLDYPLAMSSSMAVVPLIAGLVIGRSVRTRIEEDLFRKLVLAILIVSGLGMLWRAWNF